MLSSLVFFQSIWSAANDFILKQVDVKSTLAFKNMFWENKVFRSQQFHCICTYFWKGNNNSQIVRIFKCNRCSVYIESLHCLIFSIVAINNILCCQRFAIAPFEVFLNFNSINQTIFGCFDAVCNNIINASIGVHSCQRCKEHVVCHQSITVCGGKWIECISGICFNRNCECIGSCCFFTLAAFFCCCSGGFCSGCCCLRFCKFF